MTRKKKKRSGCLLMLIKVPIMLFVIFWDYIIHFKPTPLIGKKTKKI